MSLPLADTDGRPLATADAAPVNAESPCGCCGCASYARLNPCPPDVGPVVIGPGGVPGGTGCDEGARAEAWICSTAPVEGFGLPEHVEPTVGGLLAHLAATEGNTAQRVVLVDGLIGCWVLRVSQGLTPAAQVRAAGGATAGDGAAVRPTPGGGTSCDDPACRYGGLWISAAGTCATGRNLPPGGVWACAAWMAGQGCRVVPVVLEPGTEPVCVIFGGSGSEYRPRENIPAGALVLDDAATPAEGGGRTWSAVFAAAPGECCRCGVFTGSEATGQVRCAVREIIPTRPDGTPDEAARFWCCCGRVFYRPDGSVAYLDARWQLDLYTYRYEDPYVEVEGWIEPAPGVRLGNQGVGPIGAPMGEYLPTRYAYRWRRKESGLTYIDRTEAPVMFLCGLEPFGLLLRPVGVSGPFVRSSVSDQRNCSVRVYRERNELLAPDGSVVGVEEVAWNAGATVSFVPPCAGGCLDGGAGTGGPAPGTGGCGGCGQNGQDVDDAAAVALLEQSQGGA